VDPIERVLNLLTLLHEASRPLSRAEIVDRLAVGSTPYPADEAAQHQLFTSDRRTISVGLGIAIRQRVRGGDQAGQTEYWIDRADVHLPDLRLDDDERLALSLALAAVSRSLPDAGEALLKLGSGWAGESPFDFNVDVPEVVIDVLDATRRAAVVEVTDAAGGRRFEPWAVVLDHGTWLALGHDPGSDDTRTIRLDRLSAATVVEGAVRTRPPPALDRSRIRALVSRAVDEPVTATVIVDEITAARAALSPAVIERSQGDLFGQRTLRVRVGEAAGLRGWLLTLGDRARLIAPASLRDGIVAWLEAIANHEPSGAQPPSRPPTPARRTGPEPVVARLHRLLAIVPWLYRHGSASVEEIAARVGTTRAQVVRDLTLASMCGLPPYTADELYGFWVDAERGMVHVLGPTLLTEEVRLTARQAAAVAVALSALEALPGGDHDVTARLHAKLEAALGDLPVRVELDEPPFLDDVRTAVERHERLRIEYVDLDDRMSERVVDPLKLFVDRGSAYLITDDHLRGEERVFRVDRLLSVQPTGERFAPRPVTPPAGRTWAWMVPAREVVVRLPPGSGWMLDLYATLAQERHADGWVTVWLSVVSESWLASLLLRCGPGAEVLAPAELVDLPRRRARAALARYT
jgi:predicted DNA-binding transcriptional regulator YafY